MIRYILIDLDGTITDSALGITRSVDYALRQVMHIETEDLSTLTGYIGPPLTEGFMKYHHADEQTANACVKAYRERYETIGLTELSVYEGIPQALQTLYDAGFVLAVATSKPEIFAKQILQNISLAHYFTTIGGATLDGTIHNKQQVIELVLQRLGNPNPEQCLMLGDREHDVFGAAVHHIRTLGALWGFGSVEELQKSGVYRLFDTPADMTEWLLQQK